MGFFLGHLKATDGSLGRGVGDVAADDLVFVNQQGGINRRGGVGIVVDLIHIPHDGFSRIGG